MRTYVSRRRRPAVSFHPRTHWRHADLEAAEADVEQLLALFDDGCSHCGCCSSDWEECDACGGEGGHDGEELMQEDPLWYSPDDWERCEQCSGRGGWTMCLGRCDADGKHAPKEILS